MLIPAATLEDFPSDLSDYDARSLLAAWSVLWHPRLLARTEQLPVWYRADGPPDPPGQRLITVPSPSIAQLPDGYETKSRRSEETTWITGSSRDEMLEQLELDDLPPLRGEHRCIAVEDFFAIGFAALQIQVMTRRLRYTSNLDEIHLQNRIVAAARSFLDGDAERAIEALHDGFDCLAEERDHYFSSDPHLIDLTLTSASTIDPLLALIEESEFSTRGQVEDAGVLATPWNVLIDSEVSDAIAKLDRPRWSKLREGLSGGVLGWAGGGPATEICLEAMTLAEAEAVFVDAHQRTTETFGIAPSVYGRFAGSTPSDMTRVLVNLGYCGMIPIDFAGGTGHGDEAKVILQSAGAELEALTAKPIDAASDASFLTLGPRLGEAIDSGEIATALLAHWPGQSCDSFADLRRVASWSLSLGRFWKLDDYFRDGEHPYHHGTSEASSPDATQLLQSLVARGIANPISHLADSFRQKLSHECHDVIAGMTRLVTGEALPPGDVASHFAAAIAGTRREEARNGGNDDHASQLLINPHSIGCRASVTIPGAAPAPATHIFASSEDGHGSTVTVDIPACGFVLLRGGDRKKNEGLSLGKRIRGKLFGGPKLIADDEDRLHNEFLEATISSETGGISGVYSGATRGNRFSMRLIASNRRGNIDDETLMQCQNRRVITSNAAIGCIETSGEIIGAKSKSKLASFCLRYTLRRGSRVIEVDGELSPTSQPVADDPEADPWTEYFGARVAVVTEAAIYRALLRDKVHRVKSRRLVAPLGIVIDEAERQTLVSAGGMAFHRRVGERFLDTLISVKGESNHTFHLSYGFDMPNPVGSARSLIAPPVQVPVQASSQAAEIGWILHAAPKDVSIASLKVDRRCDGKLAAIVRLIQTRSQACKASLRLFRDVECALQLDGPSDDPLNQPLPAADVEEHENSDGPASLRTDGDLVSLSIPAHGVADLLIVFVGDEPAS